MKLLFQMLFFLLPWSVRRVALIKCFGYNINKNAKIGFSIILADKLILEENSYIGNLNFCKNIGLLWLKDNASLGSLNYITGFPENEKTHFMHVENRECKLCIGRHSAVTSRHFIDCTAGFVIGDFTTFAGIKSQVLTHSIDLTKNRQDAERVTVGDYCFVGTGSILLKGSNLPNYSVLGAGSLLNKKLIEEKSLYGGVPVKKIGTLDIDQNLYFKRKEGFVF
jgi:acetyltransferase-like isoleucine patch superfamily enzyme